MEMTDPESAFAEAFITQLTRIWEEGTERLLHLSRRLEETSGPEGRQAIENEAVAALKERLQRVEVVLYRVVRLGPTRESRRRLKRTVEKHVRQLRQMTYRDIRRVREAIARDIAIDDQFADTMAEIFT